MHSSLLKIFCIFILTLLLLAPSNSHAQDYTMDEVYESAVQKGKSCADYWVDRSGKNPSSTNYYADICSYYGACILGDALGDSSYYEKINSKYNRTNAISLASIDDNSCGILPLHLYLHNKKEQQLKLGTDAAKGNMQHDGWVRNAIDDTYMTGSLHVQAFKATNDTQYLDFAVDYLTMYMGNLQQTNGLYKHGANNSPYLWGRGNGWGAASAAELLRVIPKDHEKYDTFIDHYKKHMQGLVDAQWESGMWPQVLLNEENRNWEETSGTSMFVFALFTGLEMGILEKETFLEPAKNGWMAVKEYLSSDGKLGNVAEGFWPGNPPSLDQYLNAAKAAAGNSHGTAGFLWAATGVVRYHNMPISANHKHPNISKSTMNVSHPAPEIKMFDLKGRISSASINRIPVFSLSPGVYVHRNHNAASPSMTLIP